VGQVLYMRGLIIQMRWPWKPCAARRSAYGKGKVMTTEQVRWGLENLSLDQKKLDALGFAGVMRPVSTSCQDHMGSTYARVHTWDGAKFVVQFRLVPGRRADPQAADPRRRRQVRR
jgi:branched-chain amino acid transport system substrate-binding protein